MVPSPWYWRWSHRLPRQRSSPLGPLCLFLTVFSSNGSSLKLWVSLLNTLSFSLWCNSECTENCDWYLLTLVLDVESSTGGYCHRCGPWCSRQGGKGCAYSCETWWPCASSWLGRQPDQGWRGCTWPTFPPSLCLILSSVQSTGVPPLQGLWDSCEDPGVNCLQLLSGTRKVHLGLYRSWSPSVSLSYYSIFISRNLFIEFISQIPTHPSSPK